MSKDEVLEGLEAIRDELTDVKALLYALMIQLFIAFLSLTLIISDMR